MTDEFLTTPRRALMRDRQLELQYAVARILGDAEDVGVASAGLVRTLGEGLGWRSVAVWAADDLAGVLTCIEMWAVPGLEEWRTTTLAHRFHAGEGLPGRVWSSGQPIWLDDLQADEHFPRGQTAARVGLQHGVAFPALIGDRVAAVIECFGGPIQPPDADLVAFLLAIGQQVGAFLARMEVRLALATSEARKASVLEAAVDGIVSADARGRILDFNPAAERLFGRTRASVVGRPIAEVLVPAELREAHESGLARFLSTGERRILGRRVRTWTQRPDGQNVPVELTVTDTLVGGVLIFTAFVRDITEQRQAEIARERFIEILSHELRTPVTAIYGGSKMLARPAISPEVSATLLADIAAESDRLFRMVEDLIVLSRAERGSSDISSEPLLLGRLVERLVAAEQARWPNIDLKVTQPPAGGPPVLGEETYVEQVLRNLVSNAAKYAAEGRQVVVEVEFHDHEGRVRVLDRGPGIRAEEASRLFEIDYRSSLTKGLADGSGIGLFVARWLVETMDGRIWAAARPEGGSEFGFSLPTLQGAELELLSSRPLEL